MPLDKTQVKLDISLISPIKHNFAVLARIVSTNNLDGEPQQMFS